MTHPKDTIAQLEFMNPTGTLMESMDPRLKPDWDPNWWADNHPLGLVGLAYTTVLTRDPARAKHVYTDVLGGTLIHESSSDLTGTSNAYVQMGEATVELATPTRDGTLAADDMAAHGEIHHAAAFRVKDLDRAEQYLKSKGIEPLARDESTLLTRPDTTHGVPFRWTTSDLPAAPGQ
jgi:catechol 2,3-dioxygenase-like lactoylglutathione lyase family enzyme